MDTYLIITDGSGRQYPYLITSQGVQVEDFLVLPTDWNLDLIQHLLNNNTTIRVQNRIFRTQAIVEVGIVQHASGAQ